MKLVDYLSMLVKAYNPNQYEKLFEQPGRHFASFLFITLCLSLVLFTAIAVPVTFHQIAQLEQGASRVEELTLDARVQASEPVELLQRPRIVLDMGENVTRTNGITLTREGLLYPKYVFFGTASIPWSDVRDLRQETPTRDRILLGTIIFLLPSVIFWAVTGSIILAGLLFTFLALLGWVAPRTFKHTISMREVLKLVAVTMPSVLIFSIGLLPFGAPMLIWGGVLLSTVLFFVGIAMMSELEAPRDRRKA